MPADASRTGAPAASLPLWRQLQAAAGVLAQVLAGHSTSATLQACSPALRSAAQALAFQALRNLGRAQALRSRLARQLPPAPADALLCTALALAWDPAVAPYAPFTLVDQSVEAAKRATATRPQAAFINACLRRFLRERDALVAITDTLPEARWNHPRWWIEQVRLDQPQAWRALLGAAHASAPMTLRVNTSKVPLSQYLRDLSAIGLVAKRVADCGLQLARPVPVTQLPGFGHGAVSVQDAAAQLAAPLLLQGLLPTAGSAEAEPLRVLDACAAPGGKTAHLLELGGGRIDVTALDIDPVRCQRIDQTLQRLGLAARARVCVADAAEPSRWWDGRFFDAILLDAPCTASGIVRRHPDIPWLRRPADIPQLALQQARLLQALWPLLRPGGRLLYATCSIFLAEGSQQIDAFLANNSHARLLASPGHLLPAVARTAADLPDNDLGEHDAFFYALLEKAGP